MSGGDAPGVGDRSTHFCTSDPSSHKGTVARGCRLVEFRGLRGRGPIRPFEAARCFRVLLHPPTSLRGGPNERMRVSRICARTCSVGMVALQWASRRRRRWIHSRAQPVAACLLQSPKSCEAQCWGPLHGVGFSPSLLEVDRGLVAARPEVQTEGGSGSCAAIGAQVPRRPRRGARIGAIANRTLAGGADPRPVWSLESRDLATTPSHRWHSPLLSMLRGPWGFP